jgi:hypothetical protein
VALSKRGQAHKVDEKWMSRCNQDGVSPVQNKARINLRTMSAGQLHRLEEKMDERHVMHDTCNSANLIAKKVRIIRDDIGEDLYGKEEWANMQVLGSGWQDFLCANHSRNLHFDAFSRGFTAFVKQQVGDGLAAAKMRTGGRLRIEPDGEAFLRSICKLTHVGPKQYAKGDA